MRVTLRDWKRDWIEANGDTDDLEVIIGDCDVCSEQPSIYEGAFKNIPDYLLDKKVIKYYQIIDSTIKERIGAYSLVI